MTNTQRKREREIDRQRVRKTTDNHSQNNLVGKLREIQKAEKNRIQRQ